jgi:hypothetical protein
MSDLAYRATAQTPGRGRTDWGAIWAGVFVFLGIWSVFGALGLAIFGNIANAAAPKPIITMSVGIAIWYIVLTAIAMYWAGRETGRMAGIANRHDGLIHGLIMFGLAVAGLAVLFSLGGEILAGAAGASATAHSPYVLTMWTNLGWGGFAALICGWVAAMLGGSSGVEHKAEGEVREIRPAA